jgi:hypothetical protein
MSQEIKTIRQANDWLASVGENRHVFKSLKSAQLTVAQVEKRIASKTPSAAAPVAATPKASEPTSIDSMRAAAKAERDPSKKVDLYEKLSSRLESDLRAESNSLSPKAIEIRRELQASQTAEAYSRLAEKTANPGAEKIRKLIDAAS